MDKLIDQKGENLSGLQVSDNFGLLIKHFREIRNMTLKDVEMRSGVSGSYVNRLEKGERKSPGLPTVFKIADALQIPYYELITTAFVEAASSKRDEQSLPEVLIQNDFFIGDEIVNKNAKQLLVQINEQILSSQWDEQSKIKEMLEISQLIDRFKKAI
ncbi:helix-turn-helix domain-containing protein [Domibacillus antri]|nr:helix-turn-helix transcriptional regulator [Domibacillus antri]